MFIAVAYSVTRVVFLTVYFYCMVFIKRSPRQAIASGRSFNKDHIYDGNKLIIANHEQRFSHFLLKFSTVWNCLHSKITAVANLLDFMNDLHKYGGDERNPPPDFRARVLHHWNSSRVYFILLLCRTGSWQCQRTAGGVRLHLPTLYVRQNAVFTVLLVRVHVVNVGFHHIPAIGFVFFCTFNL